MKFAIAILFCCLFPVQAAPRIVGGAEAPEGKYPYQVTIGSTTAHYCAGSILNERWILTAASCLVGRAYVVVRVGLTKLNDSVPIYKSVDVLPHKDYNETLHLNDIGLVYLERALEFNTKIQPIKIDYLNLAENSTSATLTGWGRIWPAGPLSNNLKETPIDLTSNQNCESMFNMSLYDRQICGITEKQGACNGDIGGPLVRSDYQIGISSSAACGLKNKPDIYTKVYPYLNWIMSTVFP